MGFFDFVSSVGKKLHGKANTQDDKEKAVMCAGNFAGIDKVSDADFTVLNPTPPGVFHEVRKGESLSLIAKAYYGIIMAYPAERVVAVRG